MTPDRTQLTLLLEVADQIGAICLELSPALIIQQQMIRQQLEVCLEQAGSDEERVETVERIHR